MEATGITTAELEAALGGLYTAPKDPDAPDFEEPDLTATDELRSLQARPVSPSPTCKQRSVTYTAPSLEDAA